MRDLFVLSFVVQGALVLLSYVLFWPQQDKWAGLRDPIMFYIWCSTACLSALGFCNFSAALFQVEDENRLYTVTIYPYSFFLAISAIHMPLATIAHKTAIILSLLLSSVSASILLYCSVVLFDWCWITLCMAFLAFHCTVIELFFWGFSLSMDF